MRILIFHGYLLGGTGSNVYNARLAAALVRAGHEVHLLCQDRDPFEQDWVDAAGDWDGGCAGAADAARGAARATVYRPDLGGLLPVYVADRYDGIEAKPFPELSDAELDAYLERNVAAVREVAERVRPDVALANHLVMGPVVLARALERRPLRGQDPRLRARVHRQAAAPSASSRTPARGWRARARCSSARATRPRACGRRWTTRTSRRARKLGPPGVDIAEFAPREPDEARRGPRGPGSAPRGGRGRRRAGEAPEGSSFARDPAAAAARAARHRARTTAWWSSSAS